MSSSRAPPRAQPPFQQHQSMLHGTDTSPRSTVSGTPRGTSTNVRYEEGTNRDHRSSNSAAARAEQRSTLLNTSGSQSAANPHLISPRGSNEMRVNFMKTEKERTTTSSSTLSLAHELAKTQRELERLQMELRSSKERERHSEGYVLELEATVEAQRHDNLLLRHHLANRQLLTEVLEEEKRELLGTHPQTHAQQPPVASPQPLITHVSTGTMTLVPMDNTSGYGSAPPSSSSPLRAPLLDQQRNLAGLSLPVSPTHSIPTPHPYICGSTPGPQIHPLPLHSPEVIAIESPSEQMLLTNEPFNQTSAREHETRPPHISRSQPPHRRPHTLFISMHGNTHNSFTTSSDHLSVSDETVSPTSSPSPPPHQDSTPTPELVSPRQEREMGELRELLAEAQREADTARAQHRDGAAAVQALRDRVAGQEAEMGELRELLAEAQREAGTARAQHRDGAAAVQALRDRVAEQEAELRELRELLAEAQREAGTARAQHRDGAAAVQALRDRVAGQEKSLCRTYVRRVLDGDDWAVVAETCEEELMWRLCLDCSRACNVTVDCVECAEAGVGGLQAGFFVEHRGDVNSGELKERVAAYPFPATWALFRRVVEGDSVSGPVQRAVLRGEEERLCTMETLTRYRAQLEEAYARQTLTSEWWDKRNEAMCAAEFELAEVVAASQRECTDRLEHLEEFASLLLEARESERELRDRLFAAEEDVYELRRQHDDDRDALVRAEAEARRSRDVHAARVAAQDEAMLVQVEQIVDLQEEVQVLTSVLSEKNAELENAHAKAAALSRQLDETAAAHAETLEKLKKSVAMLDTSRASELFLSKTLHEAEYRCTQLQQSIEVDAAAHRVELAKAAAERERLKEGIDVFRELLPNVLAAAQTQRCRDSSEVMAGVGESTSASALDQVFSVEGYVVAQGLREVLLHHLGRVEQLRRDKEGLADELDEAEKVCGDYMAALEDALRSLDEERALRRRTYESQLHFGAQMMRELAMMRTAEEEEAAMSDDKADMELNSNYRLPSICSSSTISHAV